MAKVFTDASFEGEVLQNDKVTVIDLWAEWCGPCRAMSPVIEELAKEYEGKADIGKLNVDENPVVPGKYGIRGIPTFLFFKNGELAGKVVGAQPKANLKAIIDELVG